MLKLVGDNPFQGVSHLSQQRAVARGFDITRPEYAANLVRMSLENGADGFMFSISDMTLSILRLLREKYRVRDLRLYAITPAAAEFARLMGPLGGIEGIVKRTAKQMIASGNLETIFGGLKGVLTMNPKTLLHSFLRYEISRVKSAAKQAIFESVMLHEMVTDLALALDLKWLFVSYMGFMKNIGLMSGFETRNFVFLVNKFREWNIGMGEVIVAAPFNKIGFQMSPSQSDCEETFASLPKSTVIAISPLAGGYLGPAEAIAYIKSLKNLKGVAVAVSNDHQAQETFKLFQIG
jgi:hypothetical protein